MKNNIYQWSLVRALLTLLYIYIAVPTQAQTVPPKSIAREWMDVMLLSIREDFARPPVQARNLFHLSVAMYDAWSAYDTLTKPYLLANRVGEFVCRFDGVPKPANVQAARDEAISYAAFRLLLFRFRNAPGAANIRVRLSNFMISKKYDILFDSTNYQSGKPAALGNYIAQQLIQMGLQDGSNEINNHAVRFYRPVNPAMQPEEAGNPGLADPNRWQPLTLRTAVDQNGNPIPALQIFQSPEWGFTQPFAMTQADRKILRRGNETYWVYHDPGQFPTLRPDGTGTSDDYKWHFSMVSIWSSHHDPNDGVRWDISPGGLGNTDPSTYPKTWAEYRTFYNYEDGGTIGKGRLVNPKTGSPYAPNIVPRGDYTRVLSQYWADGPNSETPPGHWFAIFNTLVNDHPQLVRRFGGRGPVLPPLEWDVKSYFCLGAAMHDAAISCWSIKGWYDGVRPISAIRYMAQQGQSTDRTALRYSPEGLPLVPGYIEQVRPGDSLAGPNNANLGKVKLFTWRGTKYVKDAKVNTAGCGWILAEDWVTFQKNTFVSPPFGGYVSGHSTYSRAASEILTAVTGDEYFPGGLGEYKVPAGSPIVGVERGPSKDMTLQWATYRDASNQTSLSRIWGGIHPVMDDIPGRFLGIRVANDVMRLATGTYFQPNIVSSTKQTLDLEATAFPNPTTDYINIVIPTSNGMLEAQVFDLAGALVMSTKVPLTDRAVRLDVAHLPPGMYMVKIRDTANRTAVVKLVKAPRE
jgi:Secretion system C-terminal sorting domain